MYRDTRYTVFKNRLSTSFYDCRLSDGGGGGDERTSAPEIATTTVSPVLLGTNEETLAHEKRRHSNKHTALELVIG